MKSGETVKFKTDPSKVVRTNADLLNNVYNTNFKGYMQAGYHKTTSSQTMAWMAKLDGKIHNDWRNDFEDDKTIIEEYLGDQTILPKHIDDCFTYTRRAVFEKRLDENKQQYFVFMGMYKLSSQSTRFHRILVKLSDEWQR